MAAVLPEAFRRPLSVYRRNTGGSAGRQGGVFREDGDFGESVSSHGRRTGGRRRFDGRRFGSDHPGGNVTEMTLAEGKGSKARVMSEEDVEELGRLLQALEPPTYSKEQLLAKFSEVIHTRLRRGVPVREVIGVFASKGYRVTRSEVENAAADAAARKLARRRKKGQAAVEDPPKPHPGTGGYVIPDPEMVAAARAREDEIVARPAQSAIGSVTEAYEDATVPEFRLS